MQQQAEEGTTHCHHSPIKGHRSWPSAMAAGLDGCREDSQQLQALGECYGTQQLEALLFCITKPSFAQSLGFAQMQDRGKL